MMPTGYYKSIYLVLNNSELYIYNNSTSEKENELLVLTPGVFVVSHSPIKVAN